MVYRKCHFRKMNSIQYYAHKQECSVFGELFTAISQIYM